MKIPFNYRDQAQRCNSRLVLDESQLRASTSTGSNRAARRNAVRRRWPLTQPGMRAAGRGGSCPAQRDQATSTADLLGRGPWVGFGSGEPEHVPGASTSRCHWSRTRKESQAARGQGEQVQVRSTNHADVGHGGANRSPLIVTAGHPYGSQSLPIKQSSNRYQSARGSSGMGRCKKGFEYCR